MGIFFGIEEQYENGVTMTTILNGDDVSYILPHGSGTESHVFFKGRERGLVIRIRPNELLKKLSTEDGMLGVCLTLLLTAVPR